MLKIWGRASSSNVQKVLWCCAELDIPFERLDVGGPFGGNRDPEYLSLNPNGLVRTKPEARDQAAVEAARRRGLTAWTIIDDELKDRPYLAGPELSLAEIVLGTQIYRWFAFPIERPALDNLRAWYDRLRQRPGFKAHIEQPIT